jgi:hypothetical protein
VNILDGGCTLGGHCWVDEKWSCAGLPRPARPTRCLSQRPRPRHRFKALFNCRNEYCNGSLYFNSIPVTRPAPLTPESMPTIASSAPPQRLPPGDTDLQELYDQVLSAFAEESSPSNFSPTFSIGRSNNVDPDSLYSLHSDEGVGSQVSSRPPPQSRRQSLPPLPLSLFLSLFLPLLASASPRDNNRPLHSPTTFPTSPVLGKGPRPLPKLPAPSPSSPSPYPTHMPDPSVVHDPPAKPEQCVTLINSLILMSFLCVDLDLNI